MTVGATLTGAYRRVFQDAKTRLADLGKSYEQSNKRLAAAGAVLKYKKQLDDLRGKQGQIGAAEKKALAAAEKRFAAAKKAAQQYGIEVGQAAEKHKKLTAAVGRMGREKRALERKEGAAADLGAMRTRLLGVAGVGYGFARMAGQAMAREEQAQYLRTVINAPDKDAAVGRALEHAREFSRRSLASDEEVLEIQYALNSAGLAEETARVGSELVHRLAKVTRGAPGQVGEIFGVAFNNMAGSMEGTAAEKMDRIANVLAKTQFKFQIRDFGQLGESMKYATPAAKAMQVSLEQTANAIGALNSAGLEGSMAGTAFARMLAGMTGAAEELEFEIARDDRGELDLVATLERVRDGLDGLDTDERADLLRQMFGDEGQRAAIPLLDALDRMKDSLSEIKAAAGSNLVSDEYQRFLDGGAAQWQMLGQNVRQVGEIFANALLPQITQVVGWLGQMAGRVSGAIERYPILGRLIGGLAAGIGLVIVAFGAWAAAIWVVNAAMLANPIGLTVAAIVAGAAVIYSLWDPITEAIGTLWEKLKSLGQTLREIGDSLKRSVIGKAVRKLFGVEVAEDEAPAGQAATAGGGRRGYRSAGSGASPGDSVAKGPSRAGRTVAAGVVVAAATTASGAPEPGFFEAAAGKSAEIGASLAAARQSATEFPTDLPPLPSSPAAPRGPTTITVTVGDIVIEAPAGADPEAIAALVRREMAVIMREATAEAGLTEADDAY